MSKKRVLFASSEVYPFVKTGGLADVSHSLPRALSETFNVTVILPLYRQIDAERYEIVPVRSKETISLGGNDYETELYGCTYEGIEYRFVYTPVLCEREYLYGPPECGYEDNALRFALFCRFVASLALEEAFDVVHLNDWQCGLGALYLNEASKRPKTVFTIHNLAYQGIVDPGVLPQIGVDSGYFTMEGIEYYGNVNLMKAGIAYADNVTTVSPTYAKEILTPEFGCGLEGFLYAHRNKLSGIVNGIDLEHFNPASDGALIEPYKTYNGKKKNKSAFLSSVGLKGVNDPLFAFIGRLTWQKGIDLLIETIESMGTMKCNVILLGEGEKEYAEKLRYVAKEYTNIVVIEQYDESLSHRLYAAADFLLMPSLYEPCGLNQMIAFSYGAIPIVHHTGGLVDTVKRLETFDPEKKSGYGITFKKASAETFMRAFKTAMELYDDKERLRSLAKHNMECDFSWESSAKKYGTIYRKRQS